MAALVNGSWFVWCPSCPTSAQVRCIVFGEGFWTNLASGLLPYAAVGVLAFVLLRRPRSAREVPNGSDARS